VAGGDENRPTIGLSEIGSVARVRGAVRAATWPTGKLELWEPARRGATLTPGYADRMPFKFTGKLAKLTNELKCRLFGHSSLRTAEPKRLSGQGNQR
jgi:hypothetical protein